MKRSCSEEFHSGDPRIKISRFPVISLNNIDKFGVNTFPNFQLPKHIGSFSLDHKRKYLNDLSQLRYLCLPESSAESQTEWKVDFDLGDGIMQAIAKDPNIVASTMLDHLLTWILQEKKFKKSPLFGNDNCLRGVDFVCFRGLLTLLIATPYESHSEEKSWSILATKFQNTTYLWELKDQERENYWLKRNPKQKEMSLWGFKFEQYLCSDKVDSDPDPNQPLDTNPELCCVLKTCLGNHSLIYGAEIDAVKKDSQPPWNSLEDFVELKTNRLIDNQRQSDNFKRYKLLKWWAQSFLVGIPTVICGHRDDRGVVTKLESIPVKKMPSMAKEFWNGNICMNFCKHFLGFVRQVMAEAKPTDHFIFEYDAPGKVITVRRLGRKEVHRSLLPDWYLEAMAKKESSDESEGFSPC